MKVKLILPALIEAKCEYYPNIRYSLFPPLGMATLAGYLRYDDEVEIADEHVAPLCLDDRPDLEAIQTYTSSVHRAYELADHYRKKGSHVALGGLHATNLPGEAAVHADTVFLGPGEHSWPRFLEDFRRGAPGRLYRAQVRSLDNLPPIRRELYDSARYLVPNSLTVSRGCPHSCSLCYKHAFFAGGKSFYTRRIDRILEEIEQLPGGYLYFLDDNLLCHPPFARELFAAMKGMGKVFQAAGSVAATEDEALLDSAYEAGLRCLFIGFESINTSQLGRYGKSHNSDHSYEDSSRGLRARKIMINGSFIFRLDHDTPDVFDATVDWAVGNGIETATFHVLTPYPGTRLYDQLAREDRIITTDWDRDDTRHAVFRPLGMTAGRAFSRRYRRGVWRCAYC